MCFNSKRGGSIRVKVDGIPPTERLNLSKIGGEKYLEIRIKFDESSGLTYSSPFWQRKKDYITVQNRRGLYKFNDSGECEELYSLGDGYEVCVINEKIYLTRCPYRTDNIEIFSFNEDKKELTEIGKIKYGFITEYKIQGVEGNNIYIYFVSERSGSDVHLYTYNIETNTITEINKFLGVSLGFMYRLNNEMYFKNYRDNMLCKLEEKNLTEICNCPGELIMVNDELYSLNIVPNSGHNASMDVYKFNQNKFTNIKNGVSIDIDDNGSFSIPLPNAKRFTHWTSNMNLLTNVKELYLAEKREE